MAKAKKPPRRGRIDWKKARKLRERDGKSFTEIGETLGCKRQTVSAHAKREGWVSGTEIARATAAPRREKIFRDFIERDAETIHQNLAKKHELASILLDQALFHAKRIQDGITLAMEKRGPDDEPVLVLEDPITSLRKLGLLGQNIEVIDRNLAGLKDDGWRSDPGRSGSDTETRSERISGALDEVEKDLRGGRRGRAKGKVQD